MRRNKLREKDIPMPKEVCVTRWGTWLNSVTYINQHFHGLKEIVDTLDDSTNQYIREAKQMLGNPEFKLALENIFSRYSSISDLLKLLQKRTLSPSEAMAAIHLAAGNFENFAKAKLDEVLQKKQRS